MGSIVQRTRMRMKLNDSGTLELAQDALYACLQMDEVSVVCFKDGLLRIRATKRDPDVAELWNIPQRVCKDIRLPRPVNAHSAQALMTLNGQLFLRVNDD